MPTRVRLGLLSHEDSVALPGSCNGGATVPRTAIEELARLCARLPLALRIAADRVGSSGKPLSEAIAQLAAEPRLDALAAGGDPDTAVRAVFSWSYQALRPE